MVLDCSARNCHPCRCLRWDIPLEDVEDRDGSMKGSDIRKIVSGFEADEMGVDRFSTAMRRKLTQKRKEGRGGWQFPDECPIEDLRTMLKEHIAKGDSVDIANFAMMIWNREYPNGI